ncbi:MAG: hypothetical protein GXO75_07765, partial [Calditrichaeota bacterium]|nr:hypothetical protein [Calditrichota bacterium]
MKTETKKTIPVLPKPKKWQWLGGEFIIRPTVTIYAEKIHIEHAKDLQTVISKESGITLDITDLPNDFSEKPGLVFLSQGRSAHSRNILQQYQIDYNEKMTKEGYVLIISESRVYLCAESNRGFFYGVRTLQFLMRTAKQAGVLPALAIADWPEFEMRGVTDDISRGQVST